MSITRKTLAGGLLAAVVSSPAFAFHCPADARAIDDALARSALPAGQKSEIRELRDRGMEQHQSGQHQDAVNTLAEAMRMLLQGGLDK